MQITGMKKNPGRGNSQYKGPGVEPRLVCLRNSKKVSAV